MIIARVRQSAVTTVLVSLLGCSARNPNFEQREGRRDGRADLADTGFASPDTGLASADTLVQTPGDIARWDLATALVGYWKFDDGPGKNVAVDSSGNGHDGILENINSSTAWVSGVHGLALEFPAGVHGSGVRVAASADIDAIAQFTIAGWVYRTAAAGMVASIVSRQLNDTSDEIFALDFDSEGRLVCYIGRPTPTAGALAARSEMPVDLQRWIHVAATYDGAALRVYVDGIEKGMLGVARVFPHTTTPLYLGTNKNPTGDEPVSSRLDDLLLFARALPAGAISAMVAGAQPAIR